MFVLSSLLFIGSSDIVAGSIKTGEILLSDLVGRVVCGVVLQPKIHIEKPTAKKTRVHSPPTPSNATILFTPIDAMAQKLSKDTGFADPAVCSLDDASSSHVAKPQGVFHFGLSPEEQTSILLLNKTSISKEGKVDDELAYAVTKKNNGGEAGTKKAKVVFSTSEHDSASSDGILSQDDRPLWDSSVWDEPEWPKQELVFQESGHKKEEYTCASAPPKKDGGDTDSL